jgi:sugar phosphate isomerase/epimerase
MAKVSLDRVAVSQFTTLRWSFEDDLDECQRQGISALGVWREKLDDFGIVPAGAALKTAGIAVSSLSWAGGFTGTDGRTLEDALGDAILAISQANELQAGCLVVHSGDRGSHTHNHARRILRTAIDKLLPFAEKQGVVLAIEPMHSGCHGGFTFLTDWCEAIRLLDEYASPWLKAVFDTYHLGFDPQWLSALPQLVSYAALVQLGDGRFVPRGQVNRCRLGEGVLPLRLILDTLERCGYRGWYELELLGSDIEFASKHGVGYGPLVRHSLATLGSVPANSHTREHDSGRSAPINTRRPT